jgi:uncharacterized membrane protein
MKEVTQQESEMLNRTFALVAVALALVLLAGQAGFAADDKTHEGKVVKAGEGKLTMTDKDGKNEHTHNIAANTAITIDGKAAKLEDLKAGTMVKVTMSDDKKVSKVEARTKDN